LTPLGDPRKTGFDTEVTERASRDTEVGRATGQHTPSLNSTLTFWKSKKRGLENKATARSPNSLPNLCVAAWRAL
jgi:hypothetical protein